ncbi:glycosyl hydrolase family 18 protein [Streptomyces iconiensis]|uniref:Glycosyl hydrolase family 18 protein n=1 Tax=Streptomyces iconiensis TaxID=1384038 RepID=A0ABT6ZTV6_9ACTN|nr:glycosyl hydrolase family 18 protein [Streptomyces iconiensis]MDJ1132071.1 glycosyl hydrolase family 18 protein [Streptomyces iconiensis]
MVVPQEKRMVMYYQTKHLRDGIGLISPELMLRPTPALTDLIVAAVHLNHQGPVLTINNWEPQDAGHDQMWEALAVTQRAGVHVLVLLGGAAVGTFARLAEDFEKHYGALRDFLTHYRLDGVDIDIEEEVEVGPVRELILRLREDFGSTFKITMAPVARELWAVDEVVFKGFRYRQLYRECGEEIDWFNAQFYNGWGSLRDPGDYRRIEAVSADPDTRIVPLDKVVPIALTNEKNGDPASYVEFGRLLKTVRELRDTHGAVLRGMAGWEYFNSVVPGVDGPWQWPRQIQAALTAEPEPVPVPVPEPVPEPGPGPVPGL